ncbi:MAG: hypothetical protein DRQ78_11950 [Epsilonproteobacteria bacterium]|nr:MAG: hypothetical protein DRQ78_11950 [Campylobacterota bacterium]
MRTLEEIPTNVNWKALVIKLKKKVGTSKQVAKFAGVTVAKIDCYLSGRARSPSYQSGALLLNAYFKYYNEVPCEEIGEGKR